MGLYGFLSYSVITRAREIGIRRALGARPARVIGLVLTEVGMVTATGLAVGIVGELAGSRFVTVLLYQVKPLRPCRHQTGAARNSRRSNDGVAGVMRLRAARCRRALKALRHECNPRFPNTGPTAGFYNGPTCTTPISRSEWPSGRALPQSPGPANLAGLRLSFLWQPVRSTGG